MPTSIDTSVHFLAKKAKSRLTERNENTPKEYNKYVQREKETYQMILKMATEDIIYNPISILVGKDLKTIPDSSEKQRTVLEISRYADGIRKRVRSDLAKKARDNETVVIDGKEYDPLDILRKLH